MIAGGAFSSLTPPPGAFPIPPGHATHWADMQVLGANGATLSAPVGNYYVHVVGRSVGL